MNESTDLSHPPDPRRFPFTSPATRVGLHSWRVLSPLVLRPRGHITRAFTRLGINDFRAAAAYVSRLPYGRNIDRGSALAVLCEHRGTCSTKHALLQRLAIEQGFDTQLILAIFMMSARNTPGIRDVLKRYGIARIPEAHCYLRAFGKPIDVTRAATSRVLLVVNEEGISPEQVGTYKVALHRRFLARWAHEIALDRKYGIDALWQIREECIASLASY